MTGPLAETPSPLCWGVTAPPRQPTPGAARHRHPKEVTGREELSLGPRTQHSSCTLKDGQDLSSELQGGHSGSRCLPEHEHRVGTVQAVLFFSESSLLIIFIVSR